MAMSVTAQTVEGRMQIRQVIRTHTHGYPIFDTNVAERSVLIDAIKKMQASRNSRFLCYTLDTVSHKYSAMKNSTTDPAIIQSLDVLIAACISVKAKLERSLAGDVNLENYITISQEGKRFLTQLNGATRVYASIAMRAIWIDKLMEHNDSNHKLKVSAVEHLL